VQTDEAVGIPTVEEALELYKAAGHKKEDWPFVHGNAFKAKKDGKTTRLQEGILTYSSDMIEILKALDEALPIVHKLETPGLHFLNDFVQEEVLDLEGVHLVKSNGRYVIERVKLAELLWRVEDQHNVFGLYLEKTLIFNGRSYMGKSEFCHALARELSMRRRKTAYGWGTIDKYGAVTRAGQMNAMGCFVFDDFCLMTRGNTHRLTIEEVKHLLYVRQRGTVCAFYGDAIFPEAIPRLWSVNYKSSDEPEFWFSRENHLERTEGLIQLQLGNTEYFNSPTTDEGAIAVARRAMIFTVHKPLYSEESAALFTDDRGEVADEDATFGSMAPVRRRKA
jgi:hypothetical protein